MADRDVLADYDAPVTEPETAADDSGVDPSLESLLAEYDQQEAADAPEGENTSDDDSGAAFGDVDPDPDDNPRVREVDEAMEALRGEGENRSDADISLQALTSWAVELDSERAAQRDNDDMQAALGLARDHVADLDHLPDGYAENWLLAKYVKDHAFRNAWDSRYASEHATKEARWYVKKALKQLRSDAKASPDPVATADRAAVVQAMNGATQTAPPKRPVDYRGMTDREFSDAIQREYGFRPLS